MSSRQEEKERRRQERLAAEQAERASGRRRRVMEFAGGALAVAAIAALAIVVAMGGSDSKRPSRPPAGSGLLASTAGEADGATVDGIQCQSSEQALFHIHAHLAVYVNGKPKAIPEGIGIPKAQVRQTQEGPFATGSSCLYWLHSHTRDGIVHIESPVRRTFTLGDYFDIWKEPLSSSQVGPAQGHVTAYVNGHRFGHDPQAIPLKAHEVIQLDVGSPAAAPAPYTFPQGL